MSLAKYCTHCLCRLEPHERGTCHRPECIATARAAVLGAIGTKMVISNGQVYRAGPALDLATVNGFHFVHKPPPPKDEARPVVKIGQVWQSVLPNGQLDEMCEVVGRDEQRRRWNLRGLSDGETWYLCDVHARDGSRGSWAFVSEAKPAPPPPPPAFKFKVGDRVRVRDGNAGVIAEVRSEANFPFRVACNSGIDTWGCAPELAVRRDGTFDIVSTHSRGTLAEYYVVQLAADMLRDMGHRAKDGAAPIEVDDIADPSLAYVTRSKASP